MAISKNLDFSKASEIKNKFKSYGLIVDIQEMDVPKQPNINKTSPKNIEDYQADKTKFNDLRNQFLKDGEHLVNKYSSVMHKKKKKDGIVKKYLIDFFKSM